MCERKRQREGEEKHIEGGRCREGRITYVPRNQCKPNIIRTSVIASGWTHPSSLDCIL